MDPGLPPPPTRQAPTPGIRAWSLCVVSPEEVQFLGKPHFSGLLRSKGEEVPVLVNAEPQSRHELSLYLDSVRTDNSLREPPEQIVFRPHHRSNTSSPLTSFSLYSLFREADHLLKLDYEVVNGKTPRRWWLLEPPN